MNIKIKDLTGKTYTVTEDVYRLVDYAYMPSTSYSNVNPLKVDVGEVLDEIYKDEAKQVYKAYRIHYNLC